MELYEEIRRGYAARETVKGLAKKHGVHRRMVRQAIANAIPAERKEHERERPKLAPVKEYIDQMLEGDRQAPAGTHRRSSPHATASALLGRMGMAGRT